MRPSRITLAMLIPLLLAGGMGSFWIVGTRVTPVTVDGAVERFRATTASTAPRAGVRPDPVVSVGDSTSTDAPSEEAATGEAVRPVTATRAASAETKPSTPTTPTSARPDAGVYVFETSGYEEVSFGVGARHDYPDETTLTVTHTECGSDAVWNPLEERWAEWSQCAGDGEVDLRRFITHHEFFGQVEERAIHCESPTLMRIAGDVPGSSSTSRCEGDGIFAELRTTVVDVEVLSVGGEPIETVHVRVDQELTGEARGERASDLWLARSNGLLVRLIDTTDTEVDAVFGRTHYEEEFELHLTSTQPRR